MTVHNRLRINLGDCSIAKITDISNVCTLLKKFNAWLNLGPALRFEKSGATH